MTQQLFHKGMFINRPTSSSFSGSTNQGNIEVADKPAEESEEQFFTEVHYGKRQRSSPEAVMRNQTQTKLNYWIATPAVPTSNSFTGLDELEQAGKPETQTPKPIRPPPLFIDGVKNIQPLLKLLEDLQKENMKSMFYEATKLKYNRNQPTHIPPFTKNFIVTSQNKTAVLELCLKTFTHLQTKRI